MQTEISDVKDPEGLFEWDGDFALEILEHVFFMLLHRFYVKNNFKNKFFYFNIFLNKKYFKLLLQQIIL